VSAPSVAATFSVLDLRVHRDSRGLLTPIDFTQLPFVPHRVFAVTGVPAGATRGGHGHREQCQAMICVAGRVEVELRAPYADVVRLALHPGEGLLVEPGVWAAQTYETADSALMVLASGPYDADELFHEPPDA
jgi:dTDP-4-dehydrorhamnose 3,5-epimerase-like enzyme